jgi:hypothetical protein
MVTGRTLNFYPVSGVRCLSSRLEASSSKRVTMRLAVSLLSVSFTLTTLSVP